jgi:hypothetical protein
MVGTETLAVATRDGKNHSANEIWNAAASLAKNARNQQCNVIPSSKKRERIVPCLCKVKSRSQELARFIKNPHPNLPGKKDTLYFLAGLVRFLLTEKFGHISNKRSQQILPLVSNAGGV